MIEEFEAQLFEFAGDMRVKDPFTTKDPEHTDESNGKKRIYDEFSSHAFQQFLGKVDLLNTKDKKDSQTFGKIVLALTPVG